MPHAHQPEEATSHTNTNDDYKQEVRTQGKHLDTAEQGISTRKETDDNVQYGGGKSNTLNTLWGKLKKTKTKIKQCAKPDIFNPHNQEWLSAHQISSCLTLLLHTKYRHAIHQAVTGSAHMVCSNKTLEKLLHHASQDPLPAHADFPKGLADSCLTNGPCPSIVIGDNLHFRTICVNAKTRTINFIDPFGHGFPIQVIQQVQEFYDGANGKWTYETWSHTLQTDNYNCGVWCIWVMETWMQYWSQGNITETFESFCKRQATGLTGDGLRSHYYSVLKEGCRTTVDGTSALDIAMQRSQQRRPTSTAEPMCLDESPDKSHRPVISKRQQHNPVNQTHKL